MQTVITVAINVTCKIRQNLKKHTILYYKMTPVFCHICHIITHVYLHDNDNTFPWVLTGTYHTAIFHTIFGQQIIQLLSILWYDYFCYHHCVLAQFHTVPHFFSSYGITQWLRLAFQFLHLEVHFFQEPFETSKSCW